MSRVHIDKVEHARKIKRIAEITGQVWGWVWKISLLAFVVAIIWGAVANGFWGMYIIAPSVIAIGYLIWLGLSVEIADEILANARRYGTYDD